MVLVRMIYRGRGVDWLVFCRGRMEKQRGRVYIVKGGIIETRVYVRVILIL